MEWGRIYYIKSYNNLKNIIDFLLKRMDLKIQYFKVLEKGEILLEYFIWVVIFL